MPSPRQKELIDTIDVKRFTSEDMGMFRLQSETFGVVSGNSLPNALRNLAEAVELSIEANQVGSLTVSEVEGEEPPVVTLREPSDEEMGISEKPEKLRER